jgi:hypothetical protein
MQTFVNKTFDEIASGDAASVERRHRHAAFRRPPPCSMPMLWHAIPPSCCPKRRSDRR